MNKFKHILIFDAFVGEAYGFEFRRALPGQFLLTEIAYGQKTEKKVHSNIWKEWQFYNPRKHFDYTPEDIRLPNRGKVTGCLNVIELGLYDHLLRNTDEMLLHEDMASDDSNTIKWAKRYSLFSATVFLEDRQPLTEDYAHKIKNVYELSDKDLILRASLNQPDTILVALNTIAQHIERS